MRSFAVLFAMAATAQAVQAQAAAPAAQAQASQEAAAAAAGGYHVVVVHNSESTSAEALVKVLTEKFNTDREKVLPLIEKIDKEGKAVVIAGSKDSCDAAALLFEEIGLKTEVRPLDATDMPSEYDNSDVVVGGAKQLTEALSKPDGILVAFHAPWCGPCRRTAAALPPTLRGACGLARGRCGHCKGMVEPLKEAATTLKAQGTVVMAIDGQARRRTTAPPPHHHRTAAPPRRRTPEPQHRSRGDGAEWWSFRLARMHARAPCKPRALVAARAPVTR